MEIGQKSLISYSLWNAGEARVAAMISSSDPELFPPWDTQVDIDPTVTVDSAVRFIPTKPGLFTAHLVVASNDPSDPLQIIELRGHVRRLAYDFPAIEEEEEKTTTPDEVAGCGCRTASDHDSSQGGLGAAGLAVAVALLRRRRRG